MSNTIKIAVDAMGGDGSPKKVVDGIIHHYKTNTNTFYKIFGDQEKISKFISNSLNKDTFEIIHTNEIVEGGKSIALGLEYEKRNLQDNKIITFNI